MIRARGLVLVLVLGVVTMGGGSCKTRADDFYAATFGCDPHEPERCGTTQTGEPMTCFPGKQLGGEDFCAPACDPAADAGAPPQGHRCVGGGALLRRCAPGAPSACPAGLVCYRTSLLEPDGVCVMGARLCSTAADCPSARPICAGTIVAQLAPTDSPIPIQTNGFQCLEGDCRRSACPKHEYCLGDGFEYGPPIGDLCVPRCVHGTCPPNFSCQRNLDDEVCIPGLPGVRCESDRDCLFGGCVATGVEFKICSITCEDAQSGVAGCPLLNTPGTADPFLCVHPEGAKSYCTTPRPFTGAVCALPAHGCPEGQGCYLFREGGPGECQELCDDEPHACPARGGLPHVCLEREGHHYCSPGTFGKSCRATAECIPELECLLLDAGAAGPKQQGPRICTVPCSGHTDGECAAHPLIGGVGFCAEDGLCRVRGNAGVPCDGDAFCRPGLICLNDVCVRGP